MIGTVFSRHRSRRLAAIVFSLLMGSAAVVMGWASSPKDASIQRPSKGYHDGSWHTTSPNPTGSSTSPSPLPSSTTSNAQATVTPSTTTPTRSAPSFNTQLGRALPDTLYGITTESVANLPALETAIAKHTQRPTTRIVFQQGSEASYYTAAVNTLRQHSYIMGELMDSTGLEAISVDAYRTRVRSFVQKFGTSIDLYEIGNELNGEWAGTPATINAKVQAAYDVVEKEYASLNMRSVITLNYWPSGDCHSQPWEATIAFARSMPAQVRNGVDYVLLSFYETACQPRAYPTNEQFISTFKTLLTIFPHAKVGMGELGAQGASDGLPEPSVSEKQRIITRYYGMNPDLRAALGPRYISGGFWWYYNQDVTGPNGSTLWSSLESAFNTMAVSAS